MREQLRFAPRAAGGDDRAVRKIFHRELRREATAFRMAGRPVLIRAGRFQLYVLEKFRVAIDQHVADIRAFADGAENQAGGQFRRQILQAVDGEVGLVLEQRDFEFLGEQTLGQRCRLPAPSMPFAVCRRWS